MGNAVRIARIAGIDVRVHATWVVIALLIGWSFYAQLTTLYDLGAGSLVPLAVAATLLFFASILVHELSHALMAKSKGVEVRGITLFLFGGATDADVHRRGPGAELAITIVGPLTSFVLAAVFLGAAAAVGDPDQPVAGMLATLGWINGALGVFNLLPGFPLDGGRVLRALSWKATGSLERATRLAATVGRFMGYALVVGGLALLLVAGAPGGLWVALIGWFLAQAARVERMQVEGEAPTTPTAEEDESRRAA